MVLSLPESQAPHQGLGTRRFPGTLHCGGTSHCWGCERAWGAQCGAWQGGCPRAKKPRRPLCWRVPPAGAQRDWEGRAAANPDTPAVRGRDLPASILRRDLRGPAGPGVASSSVPVTVFLETCGLLWLSGHVCPHPGGQQPRSRATGYSAAGPVACMSPLHLTARPFP